MNRMVFQRRPNKSGILFPLALGVFLSLSGTELFAAAKTWDRGGGTNNWGTAANWNPDGVPAAGDTVTLDNSAFAGTYTVAVNVNTNSLAGLTIGYVGNPNTITLAVTTKSLNVNSGTANLTILTGGQITQTANTITVSGNWTNSSGIAFNPAGGTVTFSGNGTVTGPPVADPLVAGNVGDSFFTLNVAASGKTLQLASHITCRDILGINGGILDSSAPGTEYTLKLTRNGDGLNVATGSTINNIEFFVDGPAGAGSKIISGITDALHSLRVRWPIGASVTLDFNMTCKKDLIVEADTTLLACRNPSARTHTLGNDFVCGRTGACTFSATDGGATTTFTFSGTFDNTGEISGITDPDFYAVNVADAGKTTSLSRDITLRNNLAINGGTYTTDGANRTTTLNRQDANPLTVAVGSTVTLGTIRVAPITGGTAGYTLSTINNNALNHLTINPVDVADVFTLGQDLALAGDLTVTTGTLAVAATTLTINGSASIAAARTLTASTGIIDANGTFTANTTGVVTFTGAGKLYLSGDAAPNLGVFTRATSEVIYDRAGDQTVYNTSYWDLRVNNGGGTASIGFAVTTTSIDNSLTLSGSSIVNVSAAFDQTGQTVSFGAAGTGRLILRAGVTSLGASFTAGNGTVQFTGDSALTIPAVNYYNLEIGRTGAPGNTVTIGSVSPTSLGGTLTLTDDALPPVVASVTGTFDATGRTVTFGASGVGTLRLGDAVTSLGTFTPGNGTIDYAQATSHSVLSYDYYNLSVSGGQTATIGFAVDQTTIGNGATSGVQTLTIGGTSTLNVDAAFDLSGAGNRSVTFTGAGTLELSGSVGALAAGTGSFTAGTGTVLYNDSTAGQSIASVSYYNLTIDKEAGGTQAARTATASAAFSDTSLGGALTLVGASILTAGGGINVTAPRAVTCTGAGFIGLTGGTTIDLGTFTAGTSRVCFANASAGQTIPDEAGWYEIEIDNGGQTATIGWAVTDTELLAGGGIYITGASILDVNAAFGSGAGFGSRVVSFGPTGTGQLLLGGAVSSLGTFTVGNSSVCYDDSAAGQTVIGTTYYALTLTKGTGGAAARTAAAGGAIVVSNTLTVAENGGLDTILDLGANNLTVAGTATVAGEISLSTATVDLNGSFLATGGTVTITGNGTLELSGAVTSFDSLSAGAGSSTVLYNYTGGDEVVEALTYRNLTLNPGAGRTLTAEGDFAAGRVLTVSSGKFVIPAAVDLTLGGDGGAGNDLVVSSGATLELKGGATGSTVSMADTTVIAISGTFLTNTGPSFPTVKSDNPGVTRFGFEILPGGLVTIKGLTVTSPYTSANRGLHFNPGALTTGIDCDDITFNNPEGTGAFLNIELGAGGADMFFSRPTFNGSPQYTVRTNSGWAGGRVSLSFFIGGGTVTENDQDLGAIPNPDPSNTIRWVDATVWEGDVVGLETSWNTPGNWSTGLVPTQDVDVLLPGALANYPVLDGAGGETGSIFIDPGASLTINTNLTLEVFGDFDNNGTFTMTNGTVKFRGDVPNVNPGVSPLYNMIVDKFGTGSVTLANDLALTNDLTVTTGPLQVGAFAVTVGTTGTGNLTIGDAGALRIGTGTVDVKGTFDASASGVVEFTAAGRLDLGGTVTSFGSFTPSTGTVRYDGASAQTVRSDGVTYYHLEIAKSGGSTATTEATASLVVNGNLRVISDSLTLAAAMDLAGALSLEAAAGTLNAGSFSHTIGGSLTHDGGTLTAGSSTFTFDGSGTQTLGGTASTTLNAVTAAGGATLLISPSGAATVTASGALTVTGTLQIAAGDSLTANGAVSGAGAITFLAGSGALLDANADFNLTGPLTFSGNATLRLDSTLTSLSSTPFAATTGTIILGGSSAQTIPTNLFTYYHLTLDKSGGTAASAAAATLDVDGNLIVQNAGGFSAGNALDVEGNLTMSSSGSFTLGAQSLSLGGNFSNTAGTFSVTTGPVTLDGATQSFGGSQTTTLFSLTVSGTGTKTINGSVNAGGNLSVNSTLTVTGATVTVTGSTSVGGTLNLNGGSLLDANGSFSASGGTLGFPGAGSLYLGGSVTSLGTFTGGSGTVRYDSGADQTVAAVSYNALQIAKAAGTATAAGSFSAASLTVSSGTFAAGLFTVTLSGACSISDGAALTISSGGLDVGGAFTASTTGAVTFTGAGTLTLRGAVASLGVFTSAAGCTVVYRQSGAGDQQVLVPAPSNYHHLTLNRSGQTSTTAGPLSIGGNLTISAGTLDFAANGITATGNVTVAGTLRATGGTIHADGTFDATGGTINFSGGSAVLELDGPVTAMGTLSAGTSRVIYQDTASAQTLRVASYYDLRINATGQTVTTATGGTVAVGGILEVLAGTMSMPASSAVDVSGAATVTGVGTLSLTGGATLRLGTSLSVGTAVTANGVLTASTSGGTPTITRLAAGTYPFTVRNGGRVTLNGLNLSYLNGDGLHLMSDASIASDIDEVAFSSVATVAVSYAYTCFINLRMVTATSYVFTTCSFGSVNPGAAPPQYNVVTSGAGYTGLVELLSATGSGAGALYENDSEAGIQNPPVHEIDWPIERIWDGSSSTAWSNTANWTPDTGFAPTSSEHLRIPSATRQPTLDANGFCKSIQITTGTLTMSNAALSLTVSGDFTVGTTGALNMTAGTLVFDGANTQSVDTGGTTAGDGLVTNFTVNKTAGSLSLLANLTVSGNCTLSQGNLNVGAYTLTVNGTLQTSGGTGDIDLTTGILDANGTINLAGGGISCGGACTVRAAGTVTNLGTYAPGSTDSFIYDGAGAQQILATGVSYQHLEIAKTGGSTATSEAAVPLVVNGNLRLTTGNLTAGGIFDVAGDLILESGAGTFNAAGFTHTLAGNFTHHGGTFTASTSTFTFDGTSQTIGGAAVATSFNNVTIAAAPGSNTTIASGRTVTVGGALANNKTLSFAAATDHILDVNGGFTAGAGSAIVFNTGGELRLGGTAGSLGTLTPGTGKITYDAGAGPVQTVQAITYYNLTINRSGATADTAAGTVTVSGGLTIGAGTLDVNGNTLIVSGATNLSAGALSLSTGVVNFNGACTIVSGATIVFTGSGIVTFGAATTFPADPTVWLTPSTGQVRYARSDSNHTISRNGVTGYNDLIIQCMGIVASAPTGLTLSIGQSLTVNQGTFDVGSATVNVAGDVTSIATLAIGTGTLDLASGTFDGTGGTISFSGAGVLELGGPVTDLGSLSASQGTVRYNSGGAQTVDNVAQYYHLDIPKTAGTATLGGAIVVAGNLTVSGGGTLATSAYGAAVTGTVTVSGGSTLQIAGGSVDSGSTFNAGGANVTFTGTGSLILRNGVTSLGTFTSFAGCTVSYRSAAAGDQQIQVPAPSNYHHLTLNRGSGLISTTAGALTLGGDLNVTSGVLSLGANSVTVAGTIAISSGQELRAGTATIDSNGTLNANGTGLINLTGAATLQIGGPLTSLGDLQPGASSTVLYDRTSGDLTIAPETYCNLSVNMTGRAATISGAVDVNRALTVSDGTLLVTAPGVCRVALTDTGATPDLSVAAAATLRLAGSTGGTFLRLAPGATVQVDGTFQTTTASSVKPTLTSTATSTWGITLNGTVNIAGLNLSYPDASGLLLGGASTFTAVDDVVFTSGTGVGGRFLNLQYTGAQILSSLGCTFDGTSQFTVSCRPEYTGTITMSLVTGGGDSTEDEDSTTGAADTVAGGKISWNVPTRWTGNNGTAWTDGLNWDNGVPNSTIDAVILNVANDPILNAAGSCRGLQITTGILTISAANTLSIYGNLANTGTISMSAGKILMTGTVAQTATPGTLPIAAFEVSKSSETVTLGSNLTLGSGGLTITEGTLNIDVRTVTVPAGSTLTFGGSGTRAITAVTGTLTCNGTFNGSGGSLTWTGAGTLNLNSAFTAPDTFAMAATSLCRYQDSSTDRTLFPATYGRIQINAGARTVTVGGDTTAAGLVEILGGTLDLGTTTLTAAGLATSAGATLLMNATSAAAPSLRISGGQGVAINGTLRTTRTAATSATEEVSSADNTGNIEVGTTLGFPPSGTVYVDGQAVTYTGTATGPNALTGIGGVPAVPDPFRGIGAQITTASAGITSLAAPASPPFMTVGGTLDVNGLRLSSAGSSALRIEAAAVITSGSQSDTLQGIAFIDFAGGTALTLLRSGAPGAVVDLKAPDCTFDSAAGTNVNASVSGGATLIARFEFPSMVASDRSGETFDLENDVNSNNTLETPAQAGEAVVLWTESVAPAVQGEPQLFVTPAFDLDTGEWYATYVTSKRTGDDAVYVLDRYGNVMFEFAIPSANGAVVGLPFWDTSPVNPRERLVFIGTDAGMLYALVNTGAALVPWAAWGTNPIDVGNGITSSVVPFSNDYENAYYAAGDHFIFFGGSQGADAGLFAYRAPSGSLSLPANPGATEIVMNTVTSFPSAGTIRIMDGASADVVTYTDRYVSPSTTTTADLLPADTELSVVSVSGYPPSGSMTVTTGSTVSTVTYTGLQSVPTAKFTGISGGLYETTTSVALNPSDAVIQVVGVTGFAASGSLWVDTGGSQEVVTYTGKTTSPTPRFTGVSGLTLAHALGTSVKARKHTTGSTVKGSPRLAGVSGIGSVHAANSGVHADPTQYFFVNAPTSPVASAPAIDTLTLPWRMFIGANTLYGVEVKVPLGPEMTAITDAPVNAAIVVGSSGAAFVGTTGSEFHVVDGRQQYAASLPYPTTDLRDFGVASGHAGYNWPYAPGSPNDIGAVTGLADIFWGQVHFADSYGYLYGLSFQAAVLQPRYRPGGPTDSTPIEGGVYRNGNVIYVPNNGGKLFVVDISGAPTTVATYQLGAPTDKMSDVAMDYFVPASGGLGYKHFVIVGSSNGTIYYVDRTADGP
ncbi:MAG: hypothetical protein HYY93_10830 [Planctomycetes bacterium]|nr:hypothetical protein [Planctomycetota bacterium]